MLAALRPYLSTCTETENQVGSGNSSSGILHGTCCLEILAFEHLFKTVINLDLLFPVINLPETRVDTRLDEAFVHPVRCDRWCVRLRDGDIGVVLLPQFCTSKCTTPVASEVFLDHVHARESFRKQMHVPLAFLWSTIASTHREYTSSTIAHPLPDHDSTHEHWTR